MTYRHLYNKRLRLAWFLTLLIVPFLPVCMAVGILVTAITSSEAGIIAFFATYALFLIILMRLTHFPPQCVRCPYCGEKVCLRTTIRFRVPLRDSLHLREDIQAFPCCGGSLDSEIGSVENT